VISFLLWLVVVELLGLAAAPLAWSTFARLPDRGYGLSKILGVLLVTFLNYVFGSLTSLGNQPLLLVVTVALVVGLGLYMLREDRAVVGAWLRTHRTVILTQEALFIGLFALWTLVRASHPAVLTTEKPMDLAMMTASHMASTFPPYDPWMAGTTTNYYYGSYLTIGTLVTLTGVLPAVGYNLGLALLFAFVGLGTYSIVYNFTHSVVWSLLAPVFLVLLGNLDWLHQMLTPGSTGLSSFNFFSSSRVVDPVGLQTITEFPAFSFSLGDMHPHVIALPFTILCIGVALNFALASEAGWNMLGTTTARRVATILVAGIAVGALYFDNSWDWPSYLLLVMGSLLIPGLHTLSTRLLGQAAGLAVGVAILSYLLFISFRKTFQPQYGAVGVKLHGSQTGEVFIMFGLFLVPVCIYLVTLFVGSGEPATASAAAIPPNSAADRAWTAVQAAADGAFPQSAASASRAASEKPAPAPVADGANGSNSEAWDDELPLLPMPKFLSQLVRRDKTVSTKPTLKAARVIAQQAPRAGNDATTPSSSHAAATATLAKTLPAVDPELADDVLTDDNSLPRLPSLARLGSSVTKVSLVASTVLVCWALFAAIGIGTVGLLLPFAVVALYLTWREASDGRNAAALGCLVCAGGLLLVIACDLVFLKDNFCIADATGVCTDPHYRMNTVFKLYYQAWTLLSIGAVFGLFSLWHLLYGTARFVAPVLAALAILFGGPYIPLTFWANPGYFDAYTNPVPTTDPTLDASAYLAQYSGQPISITNALPADYQAIQWLRANVTGHPTVLEADFNTDSKAYGSTLDYEPFPGDQSQELAMSLISTFTGLSSVLGSGESHEGLWHGGQATTDPFYNQSVRGADIKVMYTETNPATVSADLARYNVDLIYIGRAERYVYYNNQQELVNAAIKRFKHINYAVSYAYDGVTILRVREKLGAYGP